MGTKASRFSVDVHDSSTAPVLGRRTQKDAAVRPETADEWTCYTSSIKDLDEGVMRLIDKNKTTLSPHNLDILASYYDAMERAISTAENIQDHVSSATIELRRLRLAIDNLDNAERRARALEELKLVNAGQMNLPESILHDLEGANKAYEKVITLCETSLEKCVYRTLAGRVFPCILLIVGTAVLLTLGLAFGAATAAVAIGVSPVFNAGSITGGILTTLGVGGCALAIGKASKAMKELRELLKAAEAQRNLLEKGSLDAEEIMLNAKKDVQVILKKTQTELSEAANETALTRRKYDIQMPEFLDYVDNQWKDLKELNKMSNGFMQNLIHAIDYFEKIALAPTTITLNGAARICTFEYQP